MVGSWKPVQGLLIEALESGQRIDENYQDKPEQNAVALLDMGTWGRNICL